MTRCLSVFWGHSTGYHQWLYISHVKNSDEWWQIWWCDRRDDDGCNI